MTLLHEVTARHPDGTHEVTVYIIEDGKRRGPYTYLILSEKEVEKFTWFCRIGLFGKALQILNKHRTKLIREYGENETIKVYPS